MARMTAKAKREARERANAIILGVALEHMAAAEHPVHVWEGFGWACETCDADWRELEVQWEDETQ